MFENEIKTVLSQYKESTALVNKLNKIYADYDYSGTKRNDIFYLDIRIEKAESVKNRAFDYLNNIITTRELRYYHIEGRKDFTEPEELAKFISKTNTQDFFNSITYHIGYNGNRAKNYEFTSNKYIEKNSCMSRNIRILEALQVLKTGEPINRETRNSIYKMEANTFIFHGCKVQTFKNGKLIIEFSSPEFFNDFKKRFDIGVKKSIKKRIEERKRWENS